MTFDADSIDDVTLRALRTDAEGLAPRAARERVAARLAAAGIGAFGATSVATGAFAVQAAPAVGAGVALLTNVGLVKMFAVGVLLGAGTGAGAHVTFRAVSQSREVPVVVAAAARNAAPSAPAPPPGPGLARVPDVSAESASVESTPRADAAVEVEVTLAHREGTRKDVSLGRTAAGVPAAGGLGIRPSPELPNVGAFERDTARSLAQEQALLDVARTALRQNDAARALSTVEAHRAHFPETAFDEERRALEIRALAAVGRLDAAHERLASFERRFGASLQLASLRQTLSKSH